MSLNEFLEYGLFDVFNLPHEIRFEIRQDLAILKIGSYDDIFTFINKSKLKDNEVISAKLDFLTFKMVITIR